MDGRVKLRPILIIATFAAISGSSALADDAPPPNQPAKPAPEYSGTVRAKRAVEENLTREVSAEELNLVPGAYGDPIHAMASMPGVERGPLGLGPIVIQGGRFGDTISLVDDLPVPTLFHFDGWTSILPVQMLSSVELRPSPTSIDLGRSVAGAVNAQTRASTADHVAGVVDISTGQAGVYMEGPLKDGATFQLSFRRSYLELFDGLVSQYAPQLGIAVPTIPNYLDYAARVDMRAWGGHLSLMAFGSDDSAKVDIASPLYASLFQIGGASAHQGFHRITAQWASEPPQTIRKHASLALSYQDDAATLEDGIFLHDQSILAAARFDLAGRFRGPFTWAAGLDVLVGHDWLEGFVPTPPASDELPNIDVISDAYSVKESVTWAQPAIWGRITWRPFGTGFEITPAVRVDGDTLIGRAWVDPRVSLLWSPVDRFGFHGAVGLAHQRPSWEKLLPVIGNPKLREEGAFDISGGVHIVIVGPLSIDLDIYNRMLFNAAVRTQAPGDWSSTPVPGDELYNNNGSGEAYGVEGLIRLAPWHGLFGWIAISAGQSMEQDSPSSRTEPVPFTQTYNISGVLSWEAPGGYVIGTRVRLTDGSPTIAVQGAVFDSDTENYIPIPQIPWWSNRTPPFFELDARFEKRWEFAKWGIAAYLDVQNVTNHDNIEVYAFNYKYTRVVPVNGLGIFPMIGVRGTLK